MQFDVMALERTFTGTQGSVKKYTGFLRYSIGYIFKKKFDVIHLHYFFPLAIVPWIYKKFRSKKIVVTVHGTDLYDKMNNRFARILFKRVLKDYDYIICVGEELKVDFEKKLNIPVNRVLCAGVDKNVFFPLNTAKEFDFLFVGSLIYRKGFDIVLKLIRIAIEQKQYVKWCVVGLGDYAEEITELSNSHPEYCTYFAGKTQPELNEIYNKAKWFFFPSRNEPFGLVASEAVFTGTPVICSTSGGLTEQVVDGYNGIIIRNVNDMKSITTLMNEACAMNMAEYEQFRKNCLESNNSFSLQYVCDELTNIYESL